MHTASVTSDRRVSNRRVLICLMSDQHVPNLLSVHQLRPDHLVLVVTPEKQDRVRFFLEALRLGGLDYANRYEECQLQQAERMQAMVQALDRVCKRLAGASFFVNLTGGTKPMSLGAYSYFTEHHPDARLLYVRESRPDELLDLRDENRPPERCTHRVTARQFMAGYGYQVCETDEKLNLHKNEDDRLWEAARLLALDPPERLLNLTREDWKAARRDSLELQRGWLRPPERARAALGQALGLREEGQDLVGRLDATGGRFVTGGWLEVFVAGLLRRLLDLPEMEVWDVMRDPHVGRIDSQRAENELDVAFMHHQALYVIECKTGDQDQQDQEDKRLQDALYKLEAVLSRMKALRVHMRLATTSSVNESVRRRAEIYRCPIIGREQLMELARAPEDLPLIRRTLVTCPPSTSSSTPLA
ncbi:MAG: DUF1887 family protein [Myxococcota bacterium]|nr:DUF1887 family protein [Myxococcota bacterium]